MNENFNMLQKYVRERKSNTVGFPCFPSQDGTGVYPKEINCLEIDDDSNEIVATSRTGSYKITNRSRIVKNVNYDNLFHVYDENNNEVLTIEIEELGL